jgi:hypothetical protein
VHTLSINKSLFSSCVMIYPHRQKNKSYSLPFQNEGIKRFSRSCPILSYPVVSCGAQKTKSKKQNAKQYRNARMQFLSSDSPVGVGPD